MPLNQRMRDIDHTRDVVLMVEVYDETTYVRHHKQKIVLVLSAMRHFAEYLRVEGICVEYVQLDQEGNSGSLTGELGRVLSLHHIDRIVVTEPGEWRVWEMMQTWSEEFSKPVDIRQDDHRKFCSADRCCARSGGGVVPFSLYWYFLIVNETRLKPNPRMALPYRTLARMTAERRQKITLQAEQFLSYLD